jgi:hypothetical protein
MRRQHLCDVVRERLLRVDRPVFDPTDELGVEVGVELLLLDLISRSLDA